MRHIDVQYGTLLWSPGRPAHDKSRLETQEPARVARGDVLLHRVGVLPVPEPQAVVVRSPPKSMTKASMSRPATVTRLNLRKEELGLAVHPDREHVED